MTSLLILLLIINFVRNVVAMDQLIPFRKSNKKLNSEMMIDYFIPQIMHPLIDWLTSKYI